VSLKKAFEKHKKLFSDFFIGMLDAAETGGKLGESLQMSAEYLEKQSDLKTKIKSVFAYPVIVGVMTVIAVTGLLIFVVPVFEKIYRQARITLPFPTRALIVLSDTVCEAWWALIPLSGAIIYGFRYLLKDPKVRMKWDVFKLNMPLLGDLNRKVVVSRYVRTFGMLIASGVPLVKALDVASVVANNQRLAEITGELQKAVREGRPMAQSMRQYDIFPPMIVELAASGEEAGRLSDMLGRGVDFVDKQIDRTIKSLLVKLEPALTVMLGAIVGFVLLGIYLPLFDYMGQAH
jgi:type IV pilus assembly protein PilC